MLKVNQNMFQFKIPLFHT